VSMSQEALGALFWKSAPSAPSPAFSWCPFFFFSPRLLRLARGHLAASGPTLWTNVDDCLSATPPIPLWNSKERISPRSKRARTGPRFLSDQRPFPSLVRKRGFPFPSMVSGSPVSIAATTTSQVALRSCPPVFSSSHDRGGSPPCWTFLSSLFLLFPSPWPRLARMPL